MGGVTPPPALLHRDYSLVGLGTFDQCLAPANQLVDLAIAHEEVIELHFAITIGAKLIRGEPFGLVLSRIMGEVLCHAIQQVIVSLARVALPLLEQAQHLLYGVFSTSAQLIACSNEASENLVRLLHADRLVHEVLHAAIELCSFLEQVLQNLLHVLDAELVVLGMVDLEVKYPLVSTAPVQRVGTHDTN